MTDTTWRKLDEAPREDADGNPSLVLLFLPTGWHQADRDGRPTQAAHCRVVGWWSKSENVWVTGLHPNAAAMPVYPSLWAYLPPEPEL